MQNVREKRILKLCLETFVVFAMQVSTTGNTNDFVETS